MGISTSLPINGHQHYFARSRHMPLFKAATGNIFTTFLAGSAIRAPIVILRNRDVNRLHWCRLYMI